MVGGHLGGHGALERGDVLEQFFFLRDEVGDLAALAGVKGLVDGVWRGRGGADEGLGRDGEAVDGEVGSGEGKGFVDVLFISRVSHVSSFIYQEQKVIGLRRKVKSMGFFFYLIHEHFNLIAQLILPSIALYRRKSFIEVLDRRVAHVCDEVGEIVGALQLDLALDLRDDGFGIHVFV